MAKISLIVGGARSGKSVYALECAEKDYTKRVFIATATIIDNEMKKRIEEHQKDRGNGYQTVEEDIYLVEAIGKVADTADVIVIDCMTVWLGNIFYHCGDDDVAVREWVDKFAEYLPGLACDVIVVSNEVGCGIVPNNDLARSYRDMSGYMNKRIAEKADSVYLCSCGIPVKIK